MNRSARFAAVLITMILAVLCISLAWSKVDIDYTHDIIGTGTIMTDYRMGDHRTSEAFGAVRGTGDIMDNYYFSTNNSSEIKVQDRFVLTKTDGKAVTKSVKPNLPPWPGQHGSYKLLGSRWAKSLEIESNSGPKSKDISIDLKNKIKSINTGGEFNFASASRDGAEAIAKTRISDTEKVDAGGFLAAGMVEDSKAFDYQTKWLNSSNVSIRSLVGKPRSVLYEDYGSVSGDSTGFKRLNIFAP